MYQHHSSLIPGFPDELTMQLVVMVIGFIVALFLLLKSWPWGVDKHGRTRKQGLRYLYLAASLVVGYGSLYYGIHDYSINIASDALAASKSVFEPLFWLGSVAMYTLMFWLVPCMLTWILILWYPPEEEVRPRTTTRESNLRWLEHERRNR